jgi:hypothetical protein
MAYTKTKITYFKITSTSKSGRNATLYARQQDVRNIIRDYLLEMKSGSLSKVVIQLDKDM